MRFDWDSGKAVANHAKHGLSFDDVPAFDWPRALIINRTREADGEVRYAAIGFLFGHLTTVIYTRRRGARRIISLRRANTTEERLYEKESFHG